MINSLEKLVTAFGGIPPSKNLKYVAGKLSKIAAKPLKFFLGGLAVAAAGGEMRSNYFQNRAPIKNFIFDLMKSLRISFFCLAQVFSIRHSS